MAFEARLENFSGPLQLLLELIENKELEITSVSLAKVTDDYLKELEARDVPSEELADFLTIAARLILIKSHALLPTFALEEEGDADSLAAQLKLYKEFVAATEHIERLFGTQRVAFAPARPLVMKTEITFLPPENATLSGLQIAFAGLMKRLEPFFALRQVSMERVVSVEQRIKDIHHALKARAAMTFRDLTAGASSKIEVVVSFLALLELMKQRLIRTVQSSAFGEIELKRVD